MPRLLTMRALADSGRELVKRFCDSNCLPVPALHEPTRDHSDKVLRSYYHLSSCAFYRASNIYVMLDKCAHPGYGGASWSWPGYVIDRTPHGVYCHELGHHVDMLLGAKKGRYSSDFSEKLWAEANEPAITSYCPNSAEWFAEMMRLFITNSDLLKSLRPKTYNLLRASKLKPVVVDHWPRVLAGAPKRTIEMARKKIGNREVSLYCGNCSLVTEGHSHQIKTLCPNCGRGMLKERVTTRVPPKTGPDYQEHYRTKERKYADDE